MITGSNLELTIDDLQRSNTIETVVGSGRNVIVHLHLKELDTLLEQFTRLDLFYKIKDIGTHILYEVDDAIMSYVTLEDIYILMRSTDVDKAPSVESTLCQMVTIAYIRFWNELKREECSSLFDAVFNAEACDINTGYVQNFFRAKHQACQRKYKEFLLDNAQLCLESDRIRSEEADTLLESNGMFSEEFPKELYNGYWTSKSSVVRACYLTDYKYFSNVVESLLY